jgi:hypothetical protein
MATDVCQLMRGYRYWVAKMAARLLATAALWVRIQTSLKNTKRATHSSPPPKKKNIQKIIRAKNVYLCAETGVLCANHSLICSFSTVH